MITDILDTIGEGILKGVLTSIVFLLISFIISSTQKENNEKSRLAIKEHFFITMPKAKMYCYVLISVIFILINIFFIVMIPVSFKQTQDFLIFIPIYILLFSIYKALATKAWSLEVSEVIILRRFLKQDKAFYFEDIHNAWLTSDELIIYFSDGFVLKVKNDYNCYDLFLAILYDENISISKEGVTSANCYSIFYTKSNLKLYVILITMFGVCCAVLLILHDEETFRGFILSIILETITVLFYLNVKLFKLEIDNNTIILKRFLRKNLYFDFQSIDYVETKEVNTSLDITTHYKVFLKDGSKFKFTDDCCCCNLFENSLAIRTIDIY